MPSALLVSSLAFANHKAESKDQGAGATAPHSLLRRTQACPFDMVCEMRTHIIHIPCDEM